MPLCVSVHNLPTTISRPPVAIRSPILTLHIPMMEMMKAMIRKMRPMIIRAATAWAQAEVQEKEITECYDSDKQTNKNQNTYNSTAGITFFSLFLALESFYTHLIKIYRSSVTMVAGTQPPLVLYSHFSHF